MNVQHPLFYRKIGQGHHNLLLFHGFGQDHTVFIALAEALAPQYTCYLFDLYFHGKSEWPHGEMPLEKSAWKNLVATILESNGIETFAVLGFSMGARLALATFESFPEKTSALFLVAPDGIKTSFWYSLATYPVMFRKLFRSMIKKPERFMTLIRLFRKIRLVDQGVLRFAEQQMNTEEKRARVYYSWVVFRHLTFDLTSVAGLANQHGLRITCIVGKFDKIIRAEHMNLLLKQVTLGELIVLEAGHNHLLGAALIKTLKNRQI